MIDFNKILKQEPDSLFCRSLSLSLGPSISGPLGLSGYKPYTTIVDHLKLDGSFFSSGPDQYVS